MTTYSVIIEGGIPGKGRARFSRKSGRAYTPQATVNAEAHLKTCALRDIGQILLEGPVGLEMSVMIAIPASWSEKKRLAASRGEIRPTGRPDVDNYLKLVDALNGICWRDDSQVVEARVTKYYSMTPMVVLQIRDAETLAAQHAKLAA